MFDTVISGGVIISAHDRYKPLSGSVGITDGRIAYAGSHPLTAADGRAFVDARGKIVMPGLVNGHCHGDMGFAKGGADNTTLGEQMERFAEHNWYYDRVTDEDRYHARLLTYAEALLSGTTMLVENMYWSLGPLSQEAFAKIGLRGAPAEDVRYDFYRSDGFLTDGMLEAFQSRCREYGLIPLLGTLPEEEFTRERLRRVWEIVEKSGCHFTSHLAETPWRHAAAVERMGESPVRALDRCGLLTEKYIGSHAVYLDGEEIALMAKRGAKVVNTPICEMKIADGLAPIPAFLKAGVTVALGTDGAMWSNSNDLFREMKCLLLVHSLHGGVRTLTAHDALDMATVNGAKLFGLENELGTIEQGKLADLILVDASRPHMTPLRTGRAENVSSNVVYCATGADVTDVFVGGRRLVRDRRIPGLDLGEIQRRVAAVSEKALGAD